MTLIDGDNYVGPWVLTRSALAASAAKSWRKQYFKPDGSDPNTYLYGERRQHIIDVANGLDALGAEPTHEQVDETIGNDSWTSLLCDECERSVDDVTIVGSVSNPERTVHLCDWCVTEVYLTRAKMRMFGEPLFGEQEWNDAQARIAALPMPVTPSEDDSWLPDRAHDEWGQNVIEEPLGE